MVLWCFFCVEEKNGELEAGTIFGSVNKIYVVLEEELLYCREAERVESRY